MADPTIPAPSGVDQGRWDRSLAEARRYCRWHVTPVATETRTFDGPGGRTLILPTLNLSALTAVMNDGTEVTPEWSEIGIVRLDGGCWTCKLRGITLTMSHGYADVDDFLGVVATMATRTWESGVISAQSGQVSRTWSPDLLPGDRRTLDAYRLHPRP